MSEVLKALQAPFEPNEIEWRVQSATSKDGQYKVLILPYIDSRAVQKRLDDVVGPFWKVDYEKIIVNNIEGFQATITIKLGEEWISRSDGAGATDVESIKGAYSSALKRAAVLWGIGRYLYDMKPSWVPLQQSGDIRVYGKFKVNGQTQQLSGYVNRPNTTQDQSNSQRNQRNANQNQQNNGNRQQSQPRQQQRPSNQQPNQAQNTEPLQVVKGILQNLNVPLKYVPGLLKRAGSQAKQLEDATVDELRNLVKGVFYANKYINHCRSLGLGEQESLHLAQLPMCIELSEVSALFFKMDKVLLEKAIDYVNAEKEQTA